MGLLVTLEVVSTITVHKRIGRPAALAPCPTAPCAPVPSQSLTVHTPTIFPLPYRPTARQAANQPPQGSHRQRRASFFATLFGGEGAPAGGSEYLDAEDDSPSKRAGSKLSLAAENSNKSLRFSGSKADMTSRERSGMGSRTARGGAGRRMSVGPAAAGYMGGMQRQKSSLAGGGPGPGDKNVRAGGGAGGGSLSRQKSVSMAASFDQKQQARWDRRNSMAAQIVRKDVATRTTSMVLMADELNNLEEDELDVVSEQMMMWSSFAEAWDAICDDLREDDLISDKEMHLLKFVRWGRWGKE